jgi:alpha-L-fucosidase
VQPREWVKVDGKPVVWEACQALCSWGYIRDDQKWRSIENLIQTLIDCVSKGGKLLLNVAPTARGEFDEQSLRLLSGIGEWMRRHSRSIYGCTQAPPEFRAPHDFRLTYNPEAKRLYVHCFTWPYRHLHCDGFGGKIKYAQLLNDGSEVGMKIDEWHGRQLRVGADTLTLTLPQEKPKVTVPVIELFLE